MFVCILIELDGVLELMSIRVVYSNSGGRRG